MKITRSARVLFITLLFSGQALWAANPALRLKFDETSGVTAADSSGNGNSGTFSQAPTWAPGQVGNAATFAGAYLDIPNSPSIDLAGTNLTIAGWMSTVAGSGAVVIDKPANPDDVTNNTFKNPFYQYGIERNGRNLALYVADETSTLRNFSSPSFIQDDIWFHFAVTYDGAIVRWYYNGVLTNSASAAGQLQTKGTRLRIGADDRPQQLFQQSLDDVRIYSRTLGAAEISVLAGKSVAATLVSLIGYTNEL